MDSEAYDSAETEELCSLLTIPQWWQLRYSMCCLGESESWEKAIYSVKPQSFKTYLNEKHIRHLGNLITQESQLILGNS